jgi:glutaminase
VEPTGDAFNSISLDPGTGRPRNPMINAGAIAIAGMVSGRRAEVRLERLLEMFGAYAGRAVTIDEEIYQSESDTGHRNRAIGHMLRNFDILTGDPMDAVDLYFKQCSVSVTCRDLGIMAATLANRGVNPVTGRQALRGEYVESVLSVMASCGMYDAAGEWIYNIGLPAKSGVSGGVIAVLPGQLGIGVFSPPLDARGNTVRGLRVCNDLSRHLDLHLFNRPSAGRSTIRVKFTGAEVNSSRVRLPAERTALRSSGTVIRVLQLQGHLNFATAEIVVREVLSDFAVTEYLILDLKRLLSLNESACRLLHEVMLRFTAAGKVVLFAQADRVPLLRRYLKARLAERMDERFQLFTDHDPALEWCENHLLERLLPGRPATPVAGPDDYELLEHLDPAQRQTLVSLLERRAYSHGQVIIQAGDPAGELFFLARGTVSISVPLEAGATRRIATFSAGMTFGEMAVLDRAPRSATVVAESDVECDLLRLETFDALGQTHPGIKIQLLENLARSLSRNLRKANRELSVLE